RREIGGNETPGSETLGGEKAGVTRTGGNLQHALAIVRVEVLHEPLVNRPRRGEKCLALIEPGSRLTVPVAPHAVRRRVAHRALSGMPENIGPFPRGASPPGGPLVLIYGMRRPTFRLPRFPIEPLPRFRLMSVWFAASLAFLHVVLFLADPNLPTTLRWI